MVLGRQLYIDMSGDLEDPDYFAGAMRSLREAISKKQRIAQERALGESIFGLPAPPSHSQPTPAAIASDSPIATWLVSTVGITRERSVAYTKLLEAHGVGNLRRLQKKTSENSAFLASAGINDADDASDIMQALSGTVRSDDVNCD